MTSDKRTKRSAVQCILYFSNFDLVVGTHTHTHDDGDELDNVIYAQYTPVYHVIIVLYTHSKSTTPPPLTVVVHYIYIYIILLWLLRLSLSLYIYICVFIYAYTSYPRLISLYILSYNHSNYTTQYDVVERICTQSGGLQPNLVRMQSNNRNPKNTEIRATQFVYLSILYTELNRFKFERIFLKKKNHISYFSI
jgi:hypothetical protein